MPSSTYTIKRRYVFRILCILALFVFALVVFIWRESIVLDRFDMGDQNVIQKDVFFDWTNSTIAPQCTVHGKGLARSQNGDFQLEIAPRDSETSEYPNRSTSDSLDLSVVFENRTISILFECINEQCQAHCIDIDGDSVPEVLLIAAEGRGTGATEHVLTILKIANSSFRKLLRLKVRGHVWGIPKNHQASPDALWQYTCRLKGDRFGSSYIECFRSVWDSGPMPEFFDECDLLALQISYKKFQLAEDGQYILTRVKLNKLPP